MTEWVDDRKHTFYAMKPYYEQDGITIYHGDCRDMDWRSWDTVITDPPYGTGHYETDLIVLTCEMLASWTTVAVFGWPENLVMLCSDANRRPDAWITWWPMNGACKAAARTGLVRESEHIALWGFWNWSTVKWPRSENAVRKMKRLRELDDTRKSDTQFRRPPDVWRDPSPNVGFQYAQRLHPNEKPVSLMGRLVCAVAPSVVVVDPFMGSGTTLLAAKNLGRKAIGVEVEERYCEIAAKRFAQGVLDLDS